MDNLIIGIRPIDEYISGGGKPERILIQQGLRGTNFQKLFSEIRAKRIPFQMVPVERLNKLSKQNHQGVIAFIPAIDYHSLEELLPTIIESGKTPLLLILDGITDVRNFGAIARTAECAGVHAIIVGEKATAPVNEDAIKTSAGALSRVPVCKEATVKHAINFIKAIGIEIVVCDDKAKASLYDHGFDKPVALVMGSEEKGVSRAVAKMADWNISIPMMGNISSLNVSVATGVVLFEIVRQRRK